MSLQEKPKPDPSKVPDKLSVFIGKLGPVLAESASKNNRSLGAEIRERLIKSLRDEGLIDEEFRS